MDRIPNPQSLASKLDEINKRLELAGSKVKAVLVSPDTKLETRPSGNRVLKSTDDGDINLAGFADLRLQQRTEEDMILAQKGIDLNLPLSGISVILVDRNTEETPIGVLNYIVASPEFLKVKKLVKKAEKDEVEGIEIVSAVSALNLNPEQLPHVVIPGWHYFREQSRNPETFDFESARIAAEIGKAVLTEISSKLESEGKKSIVVFEQDGKVAESDVTETIFDFGSLPEGTFVSKDDPRLNVQTSTGSLNLVDVLGQGSNEARLTGRMAKRAGQQLTDYAHLTDNQFGPIAVGDLEQLINSLRV